MMEKWNSIITRVSPPGYVISKEIKVFVVYMLGCVIYSFTFFPRYFEYYNALFEWEWVNGVHEKVLDPTKTMPGYQAVLGDSLGLFFLGIMLLLCTAALRYRYYRGETKSIYLMKRMEDQSVL